MRRVGSNRRARFAGLLTGSLALAACDGALLDLGAGGSDASPAAEASAALPASCPFIASDSDYQTLRGQTCAGSCSEAATLSRDLSAPDVLAASLTGKWTYCAGAFGPTGATGIQFFPGCVFFFLAGDDGGTAGSYATYDVLPGGAGGAPGIILHFPGGDVQADVTASSCLGRARLSMDAGAVDLASLEPSDAAVAK
jgi:hypothetical protein